MTSKLCNLFSIFVDIVINQFSCLNFLFVFHTILSPYYLFDEGFLRLLYHFGNLTASLICRSHTEITLK